MSDITFTTTAGESLESLARALTECYGAFEARIARLAADHGLPWPDPQPDTPVTAPSLADMCRLHAVDLAHSVVARRGAGGAIVAIALLGRRGDRGWLGDFAVAPEHRGRGLGHRLMAAFLEQARALGIRQVEFDVLAVNTPALRVYEAAGCRRDQRMDRFAARVGDLGPPEDRPPDIEVTPLPVGDVPRWFADTMAGQPPPCWERDLPSLLNHDRLRAHAVAEGDRQVGVLASLLEAGPSGRGRPGLRIMFAGFRPEANASHLRALLAEAARGAGGDVELTAGLEPVESRLASLLRALGFRQTRASCNMRREL